jgi:hypothetical protein
MQKLLKDVFAVIVFLLILGLAFIVGKCDGSSETEAEYEAIIENMGIEFDEDISIADNENLRINKLLSEQTEEAKVLKQQLAQLKALPADVRYITRVETVTVGVAETFPECPRNYTFTLECGLPVAYIAESEAGFDLAAADLKFKSITTITEENSATKLIAMSSLSPGNTYDLPVSDFTVYEQNTHKTFGLQIAMVGMFSLPTLDASVGASAPWLHPLPTMDNLSPRLTIGNGKLYAGIDLISYNVGKPLPIIDDLWIGTGASFSTSLDKTIDLTVSTKF